MPRIIIADDHGLIRQGLVQVLKNEFPAAVIKDVGDGETLLERVMENGWELVITDISMPGKSGLDILQEIRRHAPRLPVLVLGMLRDEQYAIRALQAGADGYLNKMSAADKIIKPIRSVSMGKRYLTSQVAEQMADNLQQHDNRQVHETLSPREFEIFTLLATGKFVSAIAHNSSSLATLPSVPTAQECYLKCT